YFLFPYILCPLTSTLFPYTTLFRSNVLDGDGLERCRPLRGGKVDRERGERAQHGAAAIGRWRHHKAGAQDGVGDSGHRNQLLGLALGGGKGCAVGLRRAGDRDVDEA